MFSIFTGRNEVVAKVIFLHLFIILFTGGVCLSACWDTTPPRSRPPCHQTTPSPPSDHTPRLGAETPLGPDTSPGPDTPRSRPPHRQTTPPAIRPHPPEQNPPWTRHPLPKQTPAYGLRAAGTHPTGMHSCYIDEITGDLIYCGRCQLL